ncbi:hypothetical protein AVEN_18836-1 [Araneus ventricosus]|uniref:Uncharacterized protein n=1 Tax=Araneus ventricosus TaxID=182803 RepID=A0A4Y2IKI2_ARAVE|nr:hypothetical protein AVEN_18836-1 [Araneus ventricosus]
MRFDIRHHDIKFLRPQPPVDPNPEFVTGLKCSYLELCLSVNTKTQPGRRAEFGFGGMKCDLSTETAHFHQIWTKSIGARTVSLSASEHDNIRGGLVVRSRLLVRRFRISKPDFTEDALCTWALHVTSCVGVKRPRAGL